MIDCSDSAPNNLQERVNYAPIGFVLDFHHAYKSATMAACFSAQYAAHLTCQASWKTDFLKGLVNVTNLD